MSLLKLTFFVIIILSNFVSSQENQLIENLDIQFDIQNNLNVREKLVYSFSEPFYDDIVEYKLNEKVSDIKVFEDKQKLDFNFGDDNILNIYLKQKIKNLTISFETDKAVFENNNIYHFFTELNFENQDVKNIEVKVILPVGYGIYENLYKPENGIISSDGQRINLNWKNLDNNKPIFLSVKFNKLSSNFIFFFVISGLILGIGFFYFFYRKILSKAIVYGFSEDEQKAINYIKNKGNIWQKELQNQFKFSRAKSTRIIKKLESKNLIKKDEFGRTNKIEWKK